MSSSFGMRVRISLFGQSHGEAVGVTIDGLPAGERIDFDELNAFLARRAPGLEGYSSPRREPDMPRFICGLMNGKTCGAPLTAIINNCDARPHDYAGFQTTPRPGHADYTALVKYGPDWDFRGGGHLSGRLTAPLCVAGGIFKQVLARRGVYVGARILSIAGVVDASLCAGQITPQSLIDIAAKPFPVADDGAGLSMRERIQRAQAEGDSVGGIIECCATGVPPGLGDPIFDGLESRIAAAILSIPAVKGVEFGSGFSAADMTGSQHNDPFLVDNGRIMTKANHHGGILGGISTGMPIIVRAAFKPTPSIAKRQQTVDISRMQSARIEVCGRHDPCIVPRAVPCLEAALAAVLVDFIIMSEGSYRGTE